MPPLAMAWMWPHRCRPVQRRPRAIGIPKKKKKNGIRDYYSVLMERSLSKNLKCLWHYYYPLHRGREDVVLAACAMLFALGSLYFMSVAASYSDRVNSKANKVAGSSSGNDTGVHDAVLILAKDLIEPSKALEQAADACSAAGMMFLVLRGVTLRTRSALVVRRIFFIVGTLLLLRGICIAVTVLPTPYPSCNPVIEKNIFYDAFLLAIRVRVACGDVFFSGHTMFMSVALFFWLKYSPSFFFGIPPGFVLVIGILLLTLSSLHYTIDIIFSFIISFTVFQTYHLIADNRVGIENRWGYMIRMIDFECELQERSFVKKVTKALAVMEEADTTTRPFFPGPDCYSPGSSSDCESDYHSVGQEEATSRLSSRNINLKSLKCCDNGLDRAVAPSAAALEHVEVADANLTTTSESHVNILDSHPKYIAPIDLFTRSTDFNIAGSSEFRYSLLDVNGQSLLQQEITKSTSPKKQKEHGLEGDFGANTECKPNSPRAENEAFDRFADSDAFNVSLPITTGESQSPLQVNTRDSDAAHNTKDVYGEGGED